MSHKKLRSQNNCLNCGHQVAERFCSHCGQENLELQDSTFHLIINYIQDIFNYDNRLWHTLKNLLLRPGRVAREYMDGKRRQNLEPIRFYLFASSIFFLLLFFTVGSASINMSNSAATNYSKRLFHLKQEKEFRHGTADTTLVNQLMMPLKDSLSINDSISIDTSGVEINLFDSSLDTAEAEGWLSKVLLKRLEERQAELQAKHEGDESQAIAAFLDEVFHSLPQLFFLSLPFFALFLKLLYFRRPINSYVEHFIFSIYHYAYLFVIMILFILVQWFADRCGIEVVASTMSYVVGGLVIYPFYYLLISMKRFYNDRWGRLIFRYFILLFLLFIILLLLFVGIAAFTLLW